MFTRKPVSASTEGSVLASPGSVALGAFIPLQKPTDFSPIDRFAQEVGRMPAILWEPQFWGSGLTRFPTPILDAFRNRGALPMITWSPSAGVAQQQTNQPAYSWRSLAAGAQDAYITQWATDAKSYGYPLAVRMMHEMNGAVYPWSIGVNGNNDPTDFVKAWRHIVDIFRAVGAHNVQFVWCVDTGPGTKNDGALYPGDNYVDWMAMDGYNAYPQRPISLFDRFDPTYKALTALSTRPIMISEVASVENPANPSDKADWIKTGFLQSIPQSFPQVRAALWFNRVGWQPTMDFPIDSSAESLAAYREVVADPYYQGVLSGPTPGPTKTSVPTATPSPTVVLPSPAFTLSVRVQTNHKAMWKTSVKSASYVKSGQRITLALYIDILHVSSVDTMKLRWALLQKQRVIAHHDQQSPLKIGTRERLWQHWDRFLAKPGRYKFKGTVVIARVTKSKSVIFTVRR